MTNNQNKNRFPKYNLLELGEYKARGWMREQMRLDLHEGIAGAYDKISANVNKNLFAAQMRKPGEMVPCDHGISQKAWWAGEHEAYWRDGLLRMAILTDDKFYIESFRQWAENILETAKETGYIGIYSKSSRLPDKGFDGELWVQSRVFQALLGWYEYTKDERVLNTIESTVHKTIDYYRNTTYFGREGSDGGVAHGVGYIDTLEALYRITGDWYYADAAVWLYDDYSNHDCICADLQLDKMLDNEKVWQDHTPHAAEALHMLGIVSFFSNNPKYADAAQNVYKKLTRHTNPGGGFVAGDLEAIGGADGAGAAATEYCSQAESIQTLNRLIAYSGEFNYGDWSIIAAMNSAQSARFHPANIAVAYLSRDNSLHMNDPKIQGGRELFSANHAASCCTLNSIRLLPYYMEGLWFKSTEKAEIVANMYGSCEVRTSINEQVITIIEETNFPFSDKVTFRIDIEKETFFDLLLRIPENSDEPQIFANDANIVRNENFIILSKKWQNGDEISVDFNFQVVRKTQHDDKEAYYQWGVLVFGLPFPAKREKFREINESGFYEYGLTAKSEEGWDYLIDHDAKFKLVFLQDGNELYPWKNPGIALQGTLLDQEGVPKDILLFPIGTSQLKRTTFPLSLKDNTTSAQEKLRFFDQDNDPMRLF